MNKKLINKTDSGILINSNISYLVVEDSISMQEYIEKCLNDLGFQGPMYKATNLQDALTNLKSNKIDFILCDWQLLPDQEGIQLLKAIRKVSSTIPFVMITSKNEIESIIKAIDLGVSEYLVKPFSKEDLMEKIKKSLKSLAD